jgi:hypothetical protein
MRRVLVAGMAALFLVKGSAQGPCAATGNYR